jgi:8-oxo-dGTP pyrophosphatase MutT (NUDIX family)
MKKERGFYQISLKLLLQNKEGEVLALKAVDNGSYAGFYDFPGGRIDVHEFETDFLEIIKREVEEEIGNEVNFKIKPKPVAIGRHLIPSAMNSSGKDIKVMYIFFEGEYKSGNIEISKEHTGYKWIDLKKGNLEQYFKSGILEAIKIYLK